MVLPKHKCTRLGGALARTHGSSRTQVSEGAAGSDVQRRRGTEALTSHQHVPRKPKAACFGMCLAVKCC